jgi:hypothetical protein
MVDVYSDREAQQAVHEIALMLQFLSERLEEIAGSLYQPPEMDAMLNGNLPFSVPVDLRGAIECTVADDLQPAVKRLRQAAIATGESLQREFVERGLG